MKRKLLVPTIVFCSLASLAQDKINSMGRFMLEDYNTAVAESAKGLRKAPADQLQGILVKVTPDADMSKLEELGFNVTYQFGDIYSGTIKISSVEELTSLPEVTCVSFGESQRPMLDFARPSGFVNDVQAGFSYNGAQHSYTGKGVIAGMMDTGMEANHINFYGADGVSRIQRLWHFYGEAGLSREYTPDNMYRFSTDNNAETHATHVAGIMGGSYNGVGTYYKSLSAQNSNSAFHENQPIPYYGLAIESDLAFSVGSLADDNIINGVKKIVDYAKSTGQPSVINLSLGANYGPHDGTDLTSQAISNCANDAIICVASGNEGEHSIFAEKELTADDTSMKVQFVDNSAYGAVDVWGSNNQKFKFSWVVYNTNTKAIEIIAEAPASGTINISSSNAVFSKYFSGSMRVTSNLSPLNNRYNVMTLCTNVKPKSGNLAGKLAMIVDGEAGQKIYAYGSINSYGNAEFDPDIFTEGWTAGVSDNSLSNLACAKNVIVVGSYCTRKYVTPLSGNSYYFPKASVGAISIFSSYGKTFEGEARPQICAPGETVISSINRTTVLTKPNETAAKAYNQWEDYDDYWDAEQGTSMATPYVSGVMALWLEAYPDLSFNQAIDVLKNASTTDAQTKRAPEAFGYGKINALAGLKYILDNFASVGSIVDDSKALIVEAVDGGYSVFVGGEQAIAASLYDLQGRMVTSVSANDNELIVPTTDLSSGVYVLKVQGANASYTRKVSVK